MSKLPQNAPPPMKQTDKMPVDVGNALFRLIRRFPEDVGKMWLTSKELHDRLIVAGVDEDLEEAHVKYILRNLNRKEKHMRKNEFGRGHGNDSTHTAYYRSTKYIDESSPKSDHWSSTNRPMRDLPYPDEGYFDNMRECSTDLDIVNEWLLGGYLEVLEAAEKAKEEAARAAAAAEASAAAASSAASNQKYGGSREVGGDGFCITHIGSRRNFVRDASAHTSACGGGAEMVYCESVGHGSSIWEKYQCSKCDYAATYDTCSYVNTDTASRGRIRSRKQPETNIRIIKSAREAGVNLSKARELFTGAGIVMPAYRNMLEQESKIREVIESLSEERLEQNRREHCAAARRVPDYHGDIVWRDSKGELRSTCRGAACMDGGGLTRAYNHRYKGNQAAFIVISLVTNMPIGIVWTNNSCGKCIRALYKYQRSGNATSSANYMQHMKHGGVCYRNSKCGPGTAEEPSAEQAAEEFLLNDAGEYRGDDTAIFLDEVVSDNDTRAPNKFIAKQAEIIGENAWRRFSPLVTVSAAGQRAEIACFARVKF
eukprot:CAMPEP_0178683350 /NCGR_PEP_ID=MMETSP0699-20121125/2262_1 /TAXON_ID=265572 /ORGANISM="Extubocellulus spinifer, Strain CCMP396" /LENGTH=540 /DNA_ID=CAMNT_0020327949 /DNA_START=236 /DNA_END=1858 /DNA_ORIENTATION=+